MCAYRLSTSLPQTLWRPSQGGGGGGSREECLQGWRKKKGLALPVCVLFASCLLPVPVTIILHPGNFSPFLSQ